jgi:hypothetical protein
MAARSLSLLAAAFAWERIRPAVDCTVKALPEDSAKAFDRAAYSLSACASSGVRPLVEIG